MENTTVYVMMPNENNRFVINDARDYQAESLNDYIESGETDEKQYSFHFETINFKIKKYKNGKGDYDDDIYVFIRENNSLYYLSKNKNKLKALCGFANRITSY